MSLERFSGKGSIKPGWFDFEIGSGDRTNTIEFESHFRVHAPSRLEAWYEVVFWKMGSQGGRADIQTSRVIQRVYDKGITAKMLWDRCSDYLNRDNQGAFRTFQELLFKSGSIAIACTFPAFSCPEKFPMVDTRIARYLAFEGRKLGFPDAPDIEKTLQRYRAGADGGVLTLRDWPFVRVWIDWCRQMSERLNGDSRNSGKVVWRPHDVEMAMFRAWGERSERGDNPRGRRYSLCFNETVT